MKLGKPHPLRLDAELEKMISLLVVAKGEAKAELMRRLLRKAAAEELANELNDYVLPQIREAVRSALTPVEERLAKINAKTSIAAATTMYTNVEVLGHLGQDVRRIHENARKKAVAFLRLPMDQLQDQDES